MAYKNHTDVDEKISEEFSSRIARCASGKRIRAIVVLRTQCAAKNMVDRKELKAKRQAMLNTIKKMGKDALPDIDNILKRYKGKRLADSPNALGYIPIETTPAGIHALAESDRIKAIMEDQAITLMQSV